VALAVLAAPAPARAATDAQRDAAVRWAVAQAGHHERGTTNCSSLIDGWIRGMGFPARPCRAWCGAYVHEAFRRQGINLSQRLIDPDRTYDDVIAGRRGLRRISRNDVRRGDLLLFALRRGLKASHLAIVRSRPSKGVVLTAEGNVSHAVRLQRRGVKYAVLAARVT
jgi:cell wall-associated NlpC family hydrolase